MTTENINIGNVKLVARFYEKDREKPLFRVRQTELDGMRIYARHYGKDLSEEEFDMGIALRFASGKPYVWPDED